MDPAKVIEAVETAFGLASGVVIGRRRTDPIASGRHAVYWILRVVGGVSYYGIGAGVGNRDHSSVIHGVQNAQWKIEHEPLYSRRVAEALRILGEEDHVSRQPCACFVGVIQNDRPTDYLPVFRKPDDKCATPGCGFRRERHHAVSAKSAA